MRWLPLFVLVLALPALARADDTDLVHASLVADVESIKPGQPFQVGLLLKIEPGWHVYWSNPGDGGMATSLELKLPEGFTASPITYPTPTRFNAAGGLISYGYESQTMLLATVTPPQKMNGSELNLSATAHWLSCTAERCVPGDAKLTLAEKVGDGAPANAELFAHWKLRLPIEASAAKTIGELSQDFELSQDARSGTESIVVRWKDAVPEKIEWFPPASEAISFSSPEINSTTSTTTIKTRFDVLAGHPLPAKPIESVLSWQAHGDNTAVKLPVHFEAHLQTVR